MMKKLDYRMISILPIDSCEIRFLSIADTNQKQSAIKIDWHGLYRLISDNDLYRLTPPEYLDFSHKV